MKELHPIRFLRTHIWVEIFASVALVTGVLLITFYLYLQDQYYTRMLQDMRNADNTVIAAAANSLNKTLDDQLIFGSEVGMNDNILRLTEAIVGSDRKASSDLRKLRNELNTMTHYSEGIAAVTVMKDGKIICEYGRYWDANGTPGLWSGENLATAQEMCRQVRARLAARTPGYYCVSTEPAWRTDPPRMNLYHIAFPLIGSRSDLDQVDGAIIISYQVQNIAQSSMLAGKRDDEGSWKYLVDAEGRIIYHINEDHIGWSEADYLSKQGMTALSMPLEHFGWSVAIAMNETALRREVFQLFQRSSMAYAAAILLALAVWALLLREILKPVRIVREAMTDAERGEPRKIKVQGEHEIWSLATEYNKLLDALENQKEKAEQEYREKMYLAEARNRAERIALESQINDHFMFNTLNAIYFSIMNTGNQEAAEMIRQLANILRYAMSQNDEVTIGKEFDIARQYLSLLKCRLVDKLDYEVTYPRLYSEWPCCKLFLQPFIENAIFHGFGNITSGGKISITGREERELFRVEIADNGCGMSEEVQQRVRGYFDSLQPLEARESKGIGIKNVIMRLKMFYGDRLEMKLESAPGEGTVFTFWLPIPGMDEEE